MQRPDVVTVDEVHARAAQYLNVHVPGRVTSVRGVDARKILVNPNGADLDSYSPATAEEKRRIR